MPRDAEAEAFADPDAWADADPDAWAFAEPCADPDACAGADPEADYEADFEDGLGLSARSAAAFAGAWAGPPQPLAAQDPSALRKRSWVAPRAAGPAAHPAAFRHQGDLYVRADVEDALIRRKQAWDSLE